MILGIHAQILFSFCSIPIYFRFILHLRLNFILIGLSFYIFSYNCLLHVIKQFRRIRFFICQFFWLLSQFCYQSINVLSFFFQLINLLFGHIDFVLKVLVLLLQSIRFVLNIDVLLLFLIYLFFYMFFIISEFRDLILKLLAFFCLLFYQQLVVLDFLIGLI